MDYKEYKKKYENYQFRIHWTSSEPFDPENEVVDVRLETKDGKYSANFITRKFLDYMFEKNKRTGECASGTYFCMPGMVVVERIDEERIKRTIDDLIENIEIEKYFEKIN